VVQSSTLPEPPKPWPTRKGKPCPECGGTEYVVTDGMPMSHWPIEGEPGTPDYNERAEASLCATCRRRWLGQAAGVPA
jgi:hypothetical protein